MLNSIRSFFSAPVFPDNEDRTRRARLLHVILVTQTYVLLFVLAGTLISVFTSQARAGTDLLVMAGGLLIIVLWRFLMRLGRISLASAGMIIFFIASVSMILYSGGTIRSAGVIYYPLAVVMATLLISRRAGVIFFILTCLVCVGLIQGEIRGILPPPSNTTGFASNAIVISGLGLTLVLLNLATQGTDNALKRAVAKEQEVRELAATLERKVEERTRALETATEVSRRLSTILDLRQLVTEVVEQVQSAFHYYHVHIYIVDEISRDLVMAGGTGPAGSAMLARHHKVQKGRGLVGRAAETNTTVLVSDVTKDPDWLSNPLLPETQSEIAVPISVGDRVLGVLDVQHNLMDGLQQADADLLQAIASQVAIAISNARSYQQSRQRAELETMINTIGGKIQHAGTVEEVLQTAIREVGEALGAERVIVSLQPAGSAGEPHAAGRNNGSGPN